MRQRDLCKRLMVKFKGEEGLDYGGIARYCRVNLEHFNYLIKIQSCVLLLLFQRVAVSAVARDVESVLRSLSVFSG